MTESKEFSYEINGKTYIQRPLVLGQVKQLQAFLKDVELPAEMTVTSILVVLADKLPRAAAIILVDPAASPKDKNLDSLAEEMEFGLPLNMAMDIIRDFFVCNPTALIFETLNGLIATMNQETLQIGSTKPS